MSGYVTPQPGSVVDPQYGTYDPFPGPAYATPAPLPALTADAFRALLPEFADTTKYPDAVISAVIAVAGNFVDQVRWGNSAAYGTALYVAHNLVLGQQAAAAIAAGGVPGASGGVVSSKSVGPLSKSYDTTLGTLEGAGAFNLTTYGVRFQQLVAIFGAGCVQL